MNPGGVRADYEAGELTEGEAYQVQPFGNEMAYATYTGAQFRQILAQQFQPTTSRPALILGVSKNAQVCLDQSAVSELEGYYEQIQGATVDARDALIASLASAMRRRTSPSARAASPRRSPSRRRASRSPASSTRRRPSRARARRRRPSRRP